MKNKKNILLASVPLILAIGIVGGIFIGRSLHNSEVSPEQQKLMTILSLIQDEYVDEVNLDSLMEGTYGNLLSFLDPHSVYIPLSEFNTINDELAESFSGVGVSFQILNDTVNVIEIVSGGPAEKVGLKPGDKILSAGKVDLTGANATNENVFKNLRGEKGSKVLLKVKRNNIPGILEFEVERGDVPQTSVDAAYVTDGNIGYIKVSKFARNTYDEFYKALQTLEAKGAEKFVIDLRGNSGGYMDQALLMAQEFLPANREIVKTIGRNQINNSVSMSNGSGHFIDNELVVLMDEFSASASEIFAGAIQDNDRGLVIGRRSFGKGLVQNQLMLPDNSAIRLTIARYYTPSGRSIQKEYKMGESNRYEMDITERYARGEFYNADSIKLDKTKVFKTTTGRKVYGGGGIMPDIFIPEDTVGMTGYYASVANAGLIQQYAYELADRYRQMLKNAKTVDQALKILPNDNTILEGFVDYAARKGVPARWYYVQQSRNRLLNQLKSIVIRDILGFSKFIELINQNDNTYKRAVKALQTGESPIIIKP